ncbi:unnamed protein product [Brassica oleracea var. botrytis]|uniref:F-box domain-containing protein n=1 Tax=Brassica cretica TaxID=69181 RepID=A0A8S9PZQ1_BRACR|nr:hypothetical protein F2Q69_00046961 [Brassica cretica]
MKFDFTTERFVRLPLPFHVSELEDNKAVLSVVKDEKLSVLHYDIQAWPNVMRIWVSNKIDEEAKDFSWRCDFVLTVDFDKFDMPGVVNLASFLLDEGNKVALCCDLGELVEGEVRTRIYIVGEDLPSDLESEILSRVPAKSLAKLKTTCKRWTLSLFRDWRFIEKNKKLSKVVRESILLSNYSEKFKVVEFEIYEFSSGSWRVLDHLTRYYKVYFFAMSLKGDTYFVDGDDETGHFLMKFDFTTERFVHLPLPFQTYSAIDNVVLSVVREEKLSVLHFDYRPHVMRPKNFRGGATSS